jgi:hypothetical protein
MWVLTSSECRLRFTSFSDQNGLQVRDSFYRVDVQTYICRDLVGAAVVCHIGREEIPSRYRVRTFFVFFFSEVLQPLRMSVGILIAQSCLLHPRTELTHFFFRIWQRLIVTSPIMFSPAHTIGIHSRVFHRLETYPGNDFWSTTVSRFMKGGVRRRCCQWPDCNQTTWCAALGACSPIRSLSSSSLQHVLVNCDGSPGIALLVKIGKYISSPIISMGLSFWHFY